MIINATCELAFQTHVPVPAVLMLHPHSGPRQWIMREEYAIIPHSPVSEYTDGFGNICQRVVAPAGNFTVRSSCTADVADEIDVDFDAEFVPAEKVPDNVLQYLVPSRYCLSDLMHQEALSIVGDLTPGYRQVEAIRSWIEQNVEYRYGSSNASTTALDTWQNRSGVCRDFAHLGMTLCRTLNIPARMVVGYLKDLEPMDLHAWFEAWVGGRWYVFDATQKTPRGNRITVAYGRDAADVALVTQFGPLQLVSMKVTVEAPPVF
ncbi:MAG TPA: transglutaminase family protein [Chthoniobacterales bacterium]|jgi:transglutaminase-like putative cysteine protease